MLDLSVDEYAHLNSPLHRWEIRYKIAGLLALIFAFSFVRDLRLLPAMLVVTLALYLLSKLPWRYLAHRLEYPGFFILMLAVILPLTTGATVLFQLGPIAIRAEGCLSVVLIVVRFGCILTVGLVCFGTAPFLDAVRALRALGLPALISDMILLAYRYLFEIGTDLMQMRTAMRLRGFRPRRPDTETLNTIGSLVGSLLVRTYERAERVYKAMRLRGYGHGHTIRNELRTRPGDVLAAIAAGLLAAAFIGAQFYLNR